MRTGRRGVSGLVVSSLLLLACGDGGSGPGLLDTNEPTELQVPSNGSYGMLVAGTFHAGKQVVTLIVGSEEFELSSYQGSLRFDTSKLRLASVAAPEGDYHVINRLDATNGVVRFAGFAVDGFDNAVELTLSFEAEQPIETGDVRFDLEVLGTDVGAEILPDQIFENQQLVPEVAR